MSYIQNTAAAQKVGGRVKLNHVDYDRRKLDDMSVSEVKKLAQSILGLQTFGFPYLFTAETVKLDKSNKLGQELNIIMHLAPSNVSGYNTCPMASLGCKAACLNTSGKGRMQGVHEGRVRKTKLFFEHRELFATLMDMELLYWEKKANQYGKKLAVRLNGTSDIQWEVIFPWLFTDYDGITFYDYTKIAKRFNRDLPSNYFLTFSRSESNDKEVQEVLSKRGNVAVVFSSLDNAMAQGYLGREVVDGVSTDRRFADPEGIIVGLKALGEAKKDETGFVVRNEQ